MALLQHHNQRCVCRHAVAPADPAYDWEVLATPRLEDGGQFFVAEERIRSFEVGPKQQSDIVAIANMMQASFRFAVWLLSCMSLCLKDRACRGCSLASIVLSRPLWDWDP